MLRSTTTLLTTIGLALAPAISADEIKVPKDFDTIQEAIDAAVEGDKIRVKAGTYGENLEIVDRTGLKLVGEGKPQIDGGDGDPALSIRNSTDILVTGFKIKNSAEDLVVIEDSASIKLQKSTIGPGEDGGVEVTDSVGVTLSKLKIKDIGTDCIEFESDEDRTRDSLIEKNRLDRCGDEGIDLTGDDNLIEKNTIDSSAGDGIQIEEGTGNRVLKNKVKKSGSDGIEVAGDGNKINKNKIDKSGDDGVDLSGENNSFSKNMVKKSDDCGLADSSGGETNSFDKNKFDSICDEDET